MEINAPTPAIKKRTNLTQQSLFKGDAIQIFEQIMHELKHGNKKLKRLPVHIVGKAGAVDIEASKLVAAAMDRKYMSKGKEEWKKEMEIQAIVLCAMCFRFIESLRK